MAGPAFDGERCCYTAQLDCGVVGRPFTVEGRARTASALSRDDWSAPATGAALAPGRHAELAAAWLQDALLEHASVAAFARLSLELLALGAPADLVAAAHLAALDEIRHAELCFALAARHAGAPQGPGPLDVGGALSAITLTTLAERAVVEGCIGETLAALVAAEQARVARDPVVVRALEEIAADEARHAELSWRIVRWALERGGREVAAAVERAFAAGLEQTLASVERSASGEHDDLAEHGRLSAACTALLIRRGLVEVVEPCAAALQSTNFETSRRYEA